MPRTTTKQGEELHAKKTVGAYLGLTGDGYSVINAVDFNDVIQKGDVVAVEPNLSPVSGDIVVVRKNQKQYLEYFVEPPPRLRLLPKGTTAKSWQQTKVREQKAQPRETIMGVVVCCTKITANQRRRMMDADNESEA